MNSQVFRRSDLRVTTSVDVCGERCPLEYSCNRGAGHEGWHQAVMESGDSLLWRDSAWYVVTDKEKPA